MWGTRKSICEARILFAQFTPVLYNKAIQGTISQNMHVLKLKVLRLNACPLFTTEQYSLEYNTMQCNTTRSNATQQNPVQCNTRCRMFLLGVIIHKTFIHFIHLQILLDDFCLFWLPVWPSMRSWSYFYPPLLFQGVLDSVQTFVISLTHSSKWISGHL